MSNSLKYRLSCFVNNTRINPPPEEASLDSVEFIDPQMLIGRGVAKIKEMGSWLKYGNLSEVRKDIGSTYPKKSVSRKAKTLTILEKRLLSMPIYDF